MVGETEVLVVIPADLAVAGAAAERARLLAEINAGPAAGRVLVEIDRPGQISVVALQLVLALGLTLRKAGRTIAFGDMARAALDRYGATLGEAA